MRRITLQIWIAIVSLGNTFCVQADEIKYFELTDTAFEENSVFILDSVEFNFDNSDLRSHSKEYLKKIATFCKEHYYLVFEVRAHTDFRGNDDFNQRLSDLRARSTVDFLIYQGVSDNRIYGSGYGETSSYTVTKSDAARLNFLSKGDVLTKEFILDKEKPEDQEACHQLNRRTELVIIKNYKYPKVVAIDSTTLFSGKSLVIPDVRFQFAKWTLLEESYPQLDLIVEFLNRFPDVIIEVSNHSDCRVSKSSSTNLSLKRAEAIKDYVVSKGVDQSRIIARGYNDTRPMKENDLIYSCEYISTIRTKAQQELLHVKNRRTELKIID